MKPERISLGYQTMYLEEVMSADGTTLIFENALINVMHEIAEDRLNGKVRPFVEGEIIGGIKPSRVLTQMDEEAGERWNRRQEEIKRLRRENTETIVRILKLEG